MQILFYAALGVHITSGTLAVLLGLLPLFTAKGGARHRRTGRWYRNLMVLVIGSAVVMTLIAMKPYFAALTLGAGISTFSGLRVLKRKRPDIDPAQRAEALDWGVVAAGLIVAFILLVAAARGEVGPSPVVLHSLIGAAIAYLLWDLWRFVFPAAWPFFPRLWFYEHLVKMLASLSAVVAAFSGSVLHFLPIAEPWKQLWSTILFHNLMVAMIIWYAFLRRRVRKWRDARPAA
jgi:uncharacterized membrane protein